VKTNFSSVTPTTKSFECKLICFYPRVCAVCRLVRKWLILFSIAVTPYGCQLVQLLIIRGTADLQQHSNWPDTSQKNNTTHLTEILNNSNIFQNDNYWKTLINVNVWTYLVRFLCRLRGIMIKLASLNCRFAGKATLQQTGQSADSMKTSLFPQM